MNREAIICFIEKIRPQIKAAGAPEDVLLKASRDYNLAPAQLESAAQILNTAQQLNFMDKSANRGDTFNLIDVPELLGRYVTHTRTSKSASAEELKNPVEALEEDFSKSAKVKKRDGKYVLLSSSGKVLGTHETAQDAYKQEYAIQKSEEREQAKSASVVLEDPTLQRELTGKRIPHVKNMLMKDAGARGEYISIGEALPEYPNAPRANHREQLRKEASDQFELQGVTQLIAEHQDQLRKEADALAYRFRTEPNFDWASAKSDALILVKDASEQAFPVLENYLKSLGSSPGTAHLKIAFVSDPAPQPGMLVEDRFEIVPTIEKVATLVSQLEALQLYDAHIKSASPTAGTKTRTERPPTGFSGSPSLLRLEEVLLPHSTFERSPDEVNQELGKNIDQGAKNLRGLLEKVPNPSQVQKGMLESMVAPFVSSKNKKQMRIDDAVDDAKTRTTVERMLLTDPIIREADPDTVVSLYNTLQQANPEISKDPNLLRFALREAIQYESVPLHTYKDLVETDEKRQKALELSQINRDRRYNIGA
jgi:hypothetical protein